MSQQQVNKLKQKISKLAASKDYLQAAEVAKDLVARQPKDIEAWWVLAQLLLQLRRYKEAIRAYYQVCQGPSPVFAQAVEQAVRLSIQHEFWDLGVPPAQELVKLRPNDPEVWEALARCWYELDHFLRAEEFYLKAAELAPNNAEIQTKLVSIELRSLRQSQAIERMHTVVKRDPSYQSLLSLATSGNYVHGLDESELSAWHRQFGELASSVKALNVQRAITSEVVKLGVVSGDLNRHSVAFFMLPLLRHLDSKRLQVYLYSTSARSDDVTESFQTLAAVWRDVSTSSAEQVSAQVYQDQIDVLMDIQGLTGRCNLPVFASKPAPLQLSYLGYPNTSGLAQIDYRLVDSVSDPEGLGDALCTETLWRMPSHFLCFSPEYLAAAELSPLPAKQGSGIRFASFNIFLKVTPELIALWAKILTALPESTLFIKSKPLRDPDLCDRVLAQFEALGIARDRIELLGWTKDQGEHMALYSKIDIHLDSFPYHGTTTTFEALYQGVPSVVLAGAVHRARVGVSIMSALEMTDWVAASADEYVAIAISKAKDIEALAQLRAGLRERLINCCLMDAPAFAKDFTEAIAGMIKAHNQKFEKAVELA